MYIPLPKCDAWLQLVMKLTITEHKSLNHDDDFSEITKLSIDIKEFILLYSLTLDKLNFYFLFFIKIKFLSP